jgi:hypothetical protein
MTVKYCLGDPSFPLNSHIPPCYVNAWDGLYYFGAIVCLTIWIYSIYQTIVTWKIKGNSVRLINIFVMLSSFGILNYL